MEAVETAKRRLSATMRDRNADAAEKQRAKDALDAARTELHGAHADQVAIRRDAERRARIASMSEVDYQRWRQDVIGRLDHIERSPLLEGFRQALHADGQQSAASSIADGMLAELGAVEALRRGGQQTKPFARYAEGYLVATQTTRGGDDASEAQKAGVAG